MIYLVLGLVLFLGVHSSRMLAGDWREHTVQRLGTGPWKGVYSLLSLAGLVLLIWGYGQARQMPVQLWSPPVAMRHVAALLTLVAFILWAAAYVPGNQIKARLHHPMVLGVKTWALAHLLANGTLSGGVLFGSFLAWAVALFVVSRKRDRAMGTVYPAGTAGRTALTVLVGLLAWAAFAMWLHGLWIGVRPLG